MSDSATRTFSTEEDVAVRELRNFDPNATKINPWKNIPNFLGGTLILLEYHSPDYHDCSVLVRGNRGTLYANKEDVMNLVSDYKPSLVMTFSSPQVVIMLISIGILITACTEVLLGKVVEEPFRAGLGAVTGYWLGQAVPRRL